MNIEVLLAIMNIDTEKKFKQLIRKNKINNVTAVNQTKNNGITIKNGNQKIYSYNEIGASKNRNRLLENATGDICIFADDDIVFIEGYETIIQKEFEKNADAEIIIFYVENKNKNREKNKKIGNKKINKINLQKIRTYEIAMKHETINKINNMNIKFDVNFGPGGIFKKGEETVFISDLLNAGIKIYGVDKKIAYALNEESSWFSGFNDKFLYDQGAIFYRIYKNKCKLMIWQYLIRKYFLYKKSVSLKQAYKLMCDGSKRCMETYENKRKEE